MAGMASPDSFTPASAHACDSRSDHHQGETPRPERRGQAADRPAPGQPSARTDPPPTSTLQAKSPPMAPSIVFPGEIGERDARPKTAANQHRSRCSVATTGRQARQVSCHGPELAGRELASRGGRRQAVG